MQLRNHYGERAMTSFSRRRFIALLGAGLAGSAVLAVAGCSSGDDAASETAAGGGAVDDTGAGSLDGVSFAVRRDPG